MPKEERMLFQGKQTLSILLLLFLHCALSVLGTTGCESVKCASGKECVELKAGPQCLEIGRQCVVCTKMMPLCACKAGERCVVHKQTCDECAYAECVDSKEEQQQLPPLPIIIEPLPVPPGPLAPMPSKAASDAGNQAMLPPLPINIEPMQSMEMGGMRKPPAKEETPSGVLKLPAEDTKGQDCVMCMQSIPKCTECIAGRESCVLVPQTCHNCAWAGCLNLEDGCLTNVPSRARLCQHCHQQDKDCQITEADNCREPPKVKCMTREKKEECKCSESQVCIARIQNGIPRKQCVDKKEQATCPLQVPPCNCPGDECVYQHRTFGSCARHFCQRTGIKCEKKPPTCKCKDMNECVLELRTFDTCDAYFCKSDCMPCATDEEDTPCLCADPEKCIWRPRTCTFCGYYECSTD